MRKSPKFSPEVVERAVRMVFDVKDQYPSQWAAIESIAGKIGGTTETLRRWVRQAQRMHEHGMRAAAFHQVHRQQGERNVFGKVRMHPHGTQHLWVAAITDADFQAAPQTQRPDTEHHEQKHQQRRAKREDGHAESPRIPGAQPVRMPSPAPRGISRLRWAWPRRLAPATSSTPGNRPPPTAPSDNRASAAATRRSGCAGRCCRYITTGGRAHGAAD